MAGQLHASISTKGPYDHSTTRSARGCHPCLRAGHLISWRALADSSGASANHKRGRPWSDFPTRLSRCSTLSEYDQIRTVRIAPLVLTAVSVRAVSDEGAEHIWNGRIWTVLGQQTIHAQPAMPIAAATFNLEHVEMSSDLAQQDYVAGHGIQETVAARLGGISLLLATAHLRCSSGLGPCLSSKRTIEASDGERTNVGQLLTQRAACWFASPSC